MTSENTIFEIGTEVEEILDRFDSSGEFEKNEILGRIDDEAMADVLINRCIFINTDNDNNKPHCAGFPLGTLVFNITDNCNLNCGYCYREDTGKEKPMMMTKATAKRAVDFLFDNSGVPDKSSGEVVIVFFEDESGLNFDLIRYIVDYARNRASKADLKRINFAITTTGTLLTPEIVKTE